MPKCMSGVGPSVQAISHLPRRSGSWETMTTECAVEFPSGSVAKDAWVGDDNLVHTPSGGMASEGPSEVLDVRKPGHRPIQWDPCAGRRARPRRTARGRGSSNVPSESPSPGSCTLSIPSRTVARVRHPVERRSNLAETGSRRTYRVDVGIGWPRNGCELEALQEQLARSAVTVPGWSPPADRPIAIGGLFVASSTCGPDRCWVGACVVRVGQVLSSAVVSGQPGAPYVPGRLALRVGPLLERSVRELEASFDVLLVNATGRDHPRGAGLALHLGAVLDVPTAGVTDRPLVAEPAGEPGDDRGSCVRLVLDGEVVGFVVRTRSGARPVIVHVGWRTDPEAARSVVLAAGGKARTPEPIRRARHLARLARAAAEGHGPSG
jgi:deoxyribonuclease V